MLRYGPVVTSSGSAFWDIGMPQFRPRYTLAQTASASPSTKTAKPMPCSHGSLMTAYPLKTLARTSSRTTRMIPTRKPGNRGPAGAAGLDTDSRGEPVDPEGQPAGEDDDIDDRHRATPRPPYDGVS